MKPRKLLLFALSALLLLPSGCASASKEAELTVVCTTYPIYVLASCVAGGTAGIAVERLDTGGGGCLHDYTLSVNDMKKLEDADAIALNGAGLEDFMVDALASSEAAVIDCSEGITLLENRSHDHKAGDEDHDHGHWDPHYWMDLRNLQIMVDGLRDAFIALDPEHEKTFTDNAQSARSQIGWLILNEPHLMGLDTVASGERPFTGLVTFHDGFQYFAKALYIPLLASIEEEAGSEASAREIVEITDLVREKNLPVIFTEVNGSDATAQAIARETGCAVAQLSMMMDGPESGDLLSQYLDAYSLNLQAVYSGFLGETEQGS